MAEAVANLETMRFRSVTSLCSLDQLPIGVSARVIKVEGNSPVIKRLLEMGVIPGAPISVIRSAPLGDPIQIRVRGYHLALRRSEAQTITVAGDEN
jgi:Fe2+ transport system protein FeoA